jgi:hypothetical protein
MIYDCDTWDVVSNVILFMEEICLILSGLEIKKHIGKKIITAITFGCITSF